MIDPRDDIVALFTDSRIGANADIGISYVKLDLRGDNENAETEGNDIGCIVLEAPEADPRCISIGGKTYLDFVTFIANLWIRKDKSINKNPDSYVNNVINEFQNTIIDNHSSLSSCEDIFLGAVTPVTPESKELYRRTIRLYAYGFKIRS